jgi:thiamine pyrophosphokinase
MILKTFDFSVYRSILCLNGNLPDHTFFSKMNLPIIAADGAANTLHNLGISPSIVVGDLDSVIDSVRKNNKLHHRPEQNSNDFTKALQYMEENALLPAIVTGINGGHLDHIINNMNIFMHTDNLLYDPPLSGIVIHKNTSKNFALPLNTKISLIGIPSACLTTLGLKWELNRAALSFPGTNSCFNRTTLPEIKIKAHEGAALILIYHEPAMDAGG